MYELSSLREELEWQIVLVAEVDEWFDELAERDWESAQQVGYAIDMLEAEGPDLGRPLVDRLKNSKYHKPEGTTAWL